MSNQQIANVSDIESLQVLSKELFSSSLFEGKNQSQILAKILTGRELGIGPIASITGINVIQGKTCLGANLIATLIARYPCYSYRILQADNKICEIEAFENKVSLGSCSFTIQEAQNAGLVNKDNWKKYPSDMLFARCITRAARRFMPAIFGGAPVYTPDELGADMDLSGRVIDGEAQITTANDVKPEDYKLPAESSDLEEMASENEVETMKNLSKELQKGDDYIEKALQTKFGHKDLTKIPKKFAEEWIKNMQKRFDEMQQFVKDMDQADDQGGAA